MSTVPNQQAGESDNQKSVSARQRGEQMLAEKDEELKRLDEEINEAKKESKQVIPDPDM
jgi:hypothetical protein